MGYLELARQLIAQAGPDFVHQRKRDDANALVKGFMTQRTDFATTLHHLRNTDLPTTYLTLPSPGPLYGFLRKLGVSSQEASRITTEERFHYQIANQAGLPSRILVKFTRNESGDIQINVYLSYSLPQSLTEAQARQLIHAISLAPPDPSPDDLAKLG